MSEPKRDIDFDSGDRVNRILEVIMSYARLDFSQKTEVMGLNDVVDAIGAGVNMLGEELQDSTLSLREKEYLLKEVHHRVKNNLQIVSSLLNLQSENMTDPKYLEMINDSRNRINSMSLVHEMLYASKDLSRIEIDEYIRRLSGSVKHAYAKPNTSIIFNYNIKPGLYFDIDSMIPIGLMLNEIISNSIKYAFPSNKGAVSIVLRDSDTGGYELIVKDNGIGLPPGFSSEKHANLGIQLILMLAKQIDGDIEIHSDNGTEYRINF